MDWAKKNYDSLILVACTALVALNAFYLYFESSSFSASLPITTTLPPSKSIATAAARESLDQALAVTEKPILWNEKSADHKERASLFVSRIYILKSNKLVDPIEGQDQLHPPITNAWLIKFGLNYADSTIKDQDSDRDGFTNLEEFNADSDPTKKESTPPKITKLQFVKFEQKPFPFVFKGDPSGDGVEFQIIKGTPSPSGIKFTHLPLMRCGEQIEAAAGMKYLILSYKKKIYPANLPPDLESRWDKAIEKRDADVNKDPILTKAREAKDSIHNALEELKKAKGGPLDASKLEALESQYALKESKDNLIDLSLSKTRPDRKNAEKKAIQSDPIKNGDFLEKAAAIEYSKTYKSTQDEIFKSIEPDFVRFIDQTEKDRSELIFENVLSKEKITLVKDATINDPASIAEFFNILNNEKFQLKKGAEFIVAPDKTTMLKLIDFSSTEAKIQDVATGTISTLPIFSSPAH